MQTLELTAKSAQCNVLSTTTSLQLGWNTLNIERSKVVMEANGSYTSP